MTRGPVPAMAHGPITPHEVAVLAVDRVVGFELGLPYRLLGLAEDAGGSPLYRVRVATLDGRTVRTSDGFSVQPDHDGSVLRSAGTVVVPGIMGGPMVREGRIPDELRAALRDAAGHARMVSICTGASVLAAAGLLAGIDLLLHLVRRDHGSEVANRVARRNVVAPWREGGQAQFVERPLPESGDVGTAATRAWAAER